MSYPSISPEFNRTPTILPLMRYKTEPDYKDLGQQVCLALIWSQALRAENWDTISAVMPFKVETPFCIPTSSKWEFLLVHILVSIRCCQCSWFWPFSYTFIFSYINEFSCLSLSFRELVVSEHLLYIFAALVSLSFSTNYKLTCIWGFPRWFRNMKH